MPCIPQCPKYIKSDLALYKLTKKISEGAFGAVYQASVINSYNDDVLHPKKVALKI